MPKDSNGGHQRSATTKDGSLGRLVGGIAYLLLLVFLVYVVIKLMKGASLPVPGQILIAVLVGMVAAALGGSLGATTAKGSIPIPVLGGRTLQFSAKGGAAAFVLFFSFVFGAFRLNEPKDKPGPAPTRFDLAVQMDDGAASLVSSGGEFSNISYKQKAPLWDEQTLAYDLKKKMYVVHEATIPDIKSTFVADFLPITRTAVKEPNATPPPFEICFVRSGALPETDDRSVTARCSSDRACRVPQGGWTSACGGVGLLDSLRPVRRAWAATEHGAPQPGWRVPSLVTLRRLGATSAGAPNYTVFSIDAESPPPAGATSFSYAIAVNGSPAFVDGWRPEDVRVPLGGGRVHLEFALEALDFSGADGGYETITVTLTFQDGSRTLGEQRLSRRIVALRDAPAESIAGSGGGQYRWSGLVVPSKVEERFAIFLESTKDLAAAQRLKAGIDGAQASIRGAEVVAILRPPLVPWRLQPYANPNYAVMLGMKEPTGQLRSSFDRKRADELCAALYEDRARYHGLVRDDIFRYQWPPVDPAQGKTRSCASIASP